MVDNLSTDEGSRQAGAADLWPARRGAVRAALRAAGAHAVVCGPGDDMGYLLGGHSVADERPCLLVIAEGGDWLLVPRLAEEELRPLCGGVSVRAWADGDDVHNVLSELLDALGVPEGSTLIVDPTLRADALLLVQAVRPAARTAAQPALVARARAVKDGDELARLRAAARLADAAVSYAWSVVEEGMSERQLSSLVRAFHEREGGDAAFAGVSFGDHSALPHHTPGDRRLEPGNAILLDTGSRLRGYQSDITRMAWFGSEPEAGFAELVAQVERAVRAGYAAARPGVTGGEVDRAARASLVAAGVGDRFVHRTGHGIGLSVHEAPYLAPGSEDRLVPGSAFTIEPGVYLPGRYGVRLEDTVVMTSGGTEALNWVTRALRVIPDRRPRG